MRETIITSKRILFIAAVVGAVLLLLSLSAGFTFSSVDGGTMAFAFKWLSLPILAVWLAVAFRTDALGKEAAHKVISSIILTVFLCSIGSGGLMWINAGIGEQKIITVSGDVVGKQSGGTKGYPTVSVQDARTFQVYHIEVSRREYESVEVGRHYQKQMRVGALGMLYARRNE